MRSYLALLAVLLASPLKSNAAAAPRSALDGAAVNSALSASVRLVTSLNAAPDRLARMLAAPAATPEARFAAQLFEHAVLSPEGLANAQDFVTKSQPEGEKIVAASLRRRLEQFVLPYHLDKDRRAAFIAAAARFGSTLSKAAPALSAEELNSTLNGFFEGAPATGRAVVPAPDPREARSLATLGDPTRLRETIELEDRFIQSPEPHLIPADDVNYHYHTQNTDETGDHVTLFVHTDSPKHSATHPRLVPPARPATGAVLVAPGSIVPSGPGSLALADDATKLAAYIRDTQWPQDRPISPAALDNMTFHLLHNETALALAAEHWIKIHPDERPRPTGPIIRLANEGLDRYFEFAPTGRQGAFPTRVLDIHRRNSPRGFNILIEWLDAGGEGAVVRHIAQLKSSELRSARAANDEDRRRVAGEFRDALSPHERKTLKLARNLGLKTFGYTDFRRSPGDSKRDGKDPRTLMDATHSHNIVTARFGSVQDLLTLEEKAIPEVNILDVMARLDPRYVLSRFFSGDGYVYSFVVTEDGQLKVAPVGPAGANLSPRSVRLAHGRRLFAAGTFSIADDGRLDVFLESNDFQEADVRWATGAAFQTSGNELLGGFLTAVFALQADRQIGMLGNRPVRRYYSDRRNPFSSHDFGLEKAGSASPRAGDPASEFIFEVMEDAETDPAAERLVWDRKNPDAVPLSYAQWLSALNRGEKGDARAEKRQRNRWAHYVLGTNPHMSLVDIKKARHKLNFRFRADQRGRYDIREAFNLIGQAYSEIESGLAD